MIGYYKKNSQFLTERHCFKIISWLWLCEKPLQLMSNCKAPHKQLSNVCPLQTSILFCNQLSFCDYPMSRKFSTRLDVHLRSSFSCWLNHLSLWAYPLQFILLATKSLLTQLIQRTNPKYVTAISMRPDIFPFTKTLSCSQINNHKLLSIFNPLTAVGVFKVCRITVSTFNISMLNMWMPVPHQTILGHVWMCEVPN